VRIRFVQGDLTETTFDRPNDYGPMKAFVLAAALAASLLPATMHGQGIRTVPYHLVRLDPALDSIVAPDSPLEVPSEHFGLTANSAHESTWFDRLERRIKCVLGVVVKFPKRSRPLREGD
jgi:hypothetical protein